MNKETTRIVFMGTPDFAVGVLDKLFENQYNIVGVITVPDKKSGRGLKVNTSAVKKYIETKEDYINGSIKLLQPVSLKEETFLTELAELKADLFIVVAFRMLPKIVWSMPPLGTFNLHASLLPKYRGAAPINWAIINGEKETGVTTFLLDEKIDTGAILFSEKCEIKDEDNLEVLHDNLQTIGADLVVKTTDALISNNVTPKSQELNGEFLPPAPKLTRETLKIDWNKSAIEIDRLIRGLSPYPAAYSALEINGKTTEAKIFKASLNSTSTLSATCGDGKTLYIEELQLAGKKRLKAKDFMLGIQKGSTISFITE